MIIARPVHVCLCECVCVVCMRVCAYICLLYDEILDANTDMFRDCVPIVNSITCAATKPSSL